MVVVLVMDRELAKFLALKFAPAACTDPWKNLERLLPNQIIFLDIHYFYPWFNQNASSPNKIIAMITVRRIFPTFKFLFFKARPLTS